LVFWGCIMNLGSPQKHFPFIYISAQTPPREKSIQKKGTLTHFQYFNDESKFPPLSVYTGKSFIWLGNERERRKASQQQDSFFVFSIDSETWLIEFCMSSRRLTGGFPLVTLARPPRDLFLNI